MSEYYESYEENYNIESSSVNVFDGLWWKTRLLKKIRLKSFWIRIQSLKFWEKSTEESISFYKVEIV